MSWWFLTVCLLVYASLSSAPQSPVPMTSPARARQSAAMTPPQPVTPSRSPRIAAQKRDAPRASSEGPVLPVSWKHHLPKEQHEWISRAMFKRDAAGRAVLTEQLRMWWFPPPPRPVLHQPPASPAAFFTRPFCIWMPYRMWAFRLSCQQPECLRAAHRLTACGLYKTVRRVLDLDGWYYLATEYLECRRCHKKVAGWSRDVLEQLDPAHRALFPAILTYRLSCDVKVVRLMRERSLGNSVTALYHKLKEQHSETWMTNTMRYLAVCKKFRVPGAAAQSLEAPPQMLPIPSPHWLLTVHAEDIRSRISEMKARITSVFGSVLKMDSTKKVTKKLAGDAAGTAAWATNVGNEFGQVLMSVLTSHEGDGLLPMAAGLMGRYRDAGVPPPKLMYVDRDCCSRTGRSKVAAMFHEWEELVVRLDVWHLMRRFSVGVTTDSHQLYGIFMAKLSACIFEWDAGDVARLREAVQTELKGKGITHSTEDELTAKLSAKLLARHCRRRTRGARETKQLIDQLLVAFTDVKDTMGIPLLDKERMDVIWDTQRQHLDCIQDPPGIQLYTKTGQVTKGGVVLPVYRCARGSTSLESFHLHLSHFIPGSSANAENFQAYLLEGLVRWNEDRASSAVNRSEQVLRCYTGHMQHALNQLSEEMLGCKLVEDYTKPREYTGELIGVEYLFSQQCKELRDDIGRDPDAPDGTPDDLSEWEDEGFGEAESYVGVDNDPTVDPLSLDDPVPKVAEAEAAASPPAKSEDASADPVLPSQEPEAEEVFRGPDGAPGYECVVRLARYLVDLRDEACLSEKQVADIVALWNRLPDVDKQRVSYQPRHRERLLQGRFKASHAKSTVSSGVESLKRCLLGEGTGPAQWPDASRLVEAICLELCDVHPHGRRVAGARVNRWAAILQDYGRIRRLVLNSPGLVQATSLQLYEINQRTLSVWHNSIQKKQEQTVLAMEIPLPKPSLTAAVPLPQPSEKVPEEYPRTFSFPTPPDLSGQAAQRRRPATAAPASAPPVQLPQPPASGGTVLFLQPSAPLTNQPALLLLQPASQPFQPTLMPGPPQPVQPTQPAQPERKWSRTTEWRRRKEAEALSKHQGYSTLPAKFHQQTHYRCSSCGQPKTREFGHSRIGNRSFCATAEGKTLEEWLAEQEEQGDR
ncbi:uncharacterized protein [Hoplias malabaricus]|uniref:uncharacterized protein isoform X2 n=2 Tax=Hoplias malabaricus TaxID=27720 RepID=UPI0034619D66